MYMFLENVEDGSTLEKIHFLFDTMSGGTSLRDHYDGKPSEAKKLVGDYEDYQFGTDFTVDFLFGFAGYKYHKLTDNSVFKEAIIKSIDADKPVIAKVKEYGFCVITGYDGDSLISPNLDHEQKNITYDELDVLFVFDNKTEPLYTLKDGLERIRQVMECTVKENLWEKYIENMDYWDWSNKPDLEERNARMNRLADTIWSTMICHNFAEVFRHR